MSKATLSLRRNADPAQPASHMIELTFDRADENPDGGIDSVPGIMMKTTEQERGIQLDGLALKVTDGVFLIALSNFDGERNLRALKQRSWFDIPIAYKNGHRDILALAKGATGTQIFNDAFAEWKQ